MNIKPQPNVIERMANQRQEMIAARLLRTVPPHMSLMSMKSQRGCRQDWEALRMRIAYGIQLAHDCFLNPEAVVELHRALTALTQIHSTAPGRAKLWYATTREASILGPALVLVDDMEELCNSKEIFTSYRASQATVRA